MSLNVKEKKYAFIGAGNMAYAITNSFVSKNVVSNSKIIMFDIDKTKYENYKNLKVNLAVTVSDAISFADYIILAVKPQFMNQALESIKKTSDISDKVFISIAAGISTEFINSILGDSVPVVRTMPNTPFMVGLGAVAISKNNNVKDIDFNIICSNLKSVATVSTFDENMMNAVVSINGSSPAYVFKFVRAMINGAIKQGFEEEDIRELALRSIEGSIEMIRQNNVPIQQLIDMVTSKKGTTEQAIISLDNDDFENNIIRAMLACTKRADELASNK